MSVTIPAGYRSNLLFVDPYKDSIYADMKSRTIDDTVKAFGHYMNTIHVKELLLDLCRDNNNGEPVGRIPSMYSLMRLLISLDKLPLEEEALNKFVNKLAKYVDGYKVALETKDPDLDLEL